MLDHRRLSYFLTVAAERSFTRAARQLHVAQPALSRQVRQLEEELGGPLLVRGGAGGVTTTPAGALLVERAPALLAQLEQAWEEARSLAGAERPGHVLRLGYAASAAHGTAPPVLAELRAVDPDITVNARMMAVPDAIRALRSGDLDAALVRQPTGTDGLVAHIVRREPQGVLMRDQHPLATGDHVTLESLDGTAIVIHPREANPGRYDRIEQACCEAGFVAAFEEPMLAFDPTHSLVASSDRVTVVSDPGPGIPNGLRWLPLSPAILLDVVLLTPLVPLAPAPVAALLRAADTAAGRHGWLGDSPATASVSHAG